MDNIIELLRPTYSEEGKRLVVQARTLLSHSEKDLSVNTHYDELFRITHTLKGNSAMFEQPEVASISKRLEFIFDSLRKGIINLSAEIIEVTYLCLSQIEVLIDSTGALSSNQWKNQRFLISKLDAIVESKKKAIEIPLDINPNRIKRLSSAFLSIQGFFTGTLTTGIRPGYKNSLASRL